MPISVGNPEPDPNTIKHVVDRSRRIHLIEPEGVFERPDQTTAESHFGGPKNGVTLDWRPQLTIIENVSHVHNVAILPTADHKTR